MNTTSVFAELLIIGLETIAWIGLLFFTLFGYLWIDFGIFNNWLIAIPFLAFAYVLGIMMDRLSDALLFGLDHAIRLQVMGEKVAESFGQLRSFILSRSPYLSSDLDYLRSRLRIMRSSMINFGLLGITGAVFVLIRIQMALETQYWAAAAALLTGAIFSALSFYAWRASAITYYLRLKTAFALLPTERDISHGDEKPTEEE